MRGRKTYLLILSLVILIGIGFAILSANLAINATVGFQHSSWDVHFANIDLNEDSSELTQPTLDSKNTALTFNTTINQPGDFYEFSVDVVNAGTMDAALDSILKNTLTKEQEKVIDYTVRTYGEETLKTNTILHAGYSEKIIVRVEYKNDVDSLEHIDDINFSLELHYVKRDLEKDYEQEVWSIDNTETENTFIVPKTGTYKLEVWGAQGASNYYTTPMTVGGYGGYSAGDILLTKNQKLYINIGKEGIIVLRKVDGGGSTHIANKSGDLPTLENDLDSIYIVSGGGGGNDTCGNINPSAGGYKANDVNTDILGGGQTENKHNDYSGRFGAGGLSFVTEDFDEGGNGGSGFYGGDGSTKGALCGAGGSSYIGNKLLTNKIMYCYKCTISDVDSTRTETTDNVSSEPISKYAKIGNGFARITLLKD